ncbi:MAG: tetratricopeptide repeat protein [bacterium]
MATRTLKSERRVPGGAPRSTRTSASFLTGSDRAWAALLVVATFVAYLPAIQAGFIWDDDRYVTENALLQSAGGLAKIWFQPGATVQYYPLVFTSFWIERALWGLNPLGYHATNVALHAATAVLLLAILRGFALPGALIAAFLFALHPVHVESVAWVTERKNVLSGFFYLTSALVYFRASAWFAPRAAHGPSARAYAVALALFVCALLSKTVTCTLPAALLVVMWWRRGTLSLRDAVPFAPMLVLGAALGATTASLERSNVGAVGSDWALSFADRILIAGRAPWFYLSKLVAPVDLTFIYARWKPDTSSALQWAYPLATLAALVALWRFRARIGRAPLAAALFFCGTLFPALGFINTYPMRYSFVADHFQYLASLGPLVIAAAGLARLVRARGAALAAGAALLFALAALTSRQAGIYESLDTLYTDTLRKNPAAWMAHNNLGVVLFDRGQVDAAENHYAAALREKEDAYEVHNNMGRLHALRGRSDDAIASFRRALEIKPDVGRIYSNLGEALEQKGLRDEAFAQFDKGAEIWPTSVPVLTARANALVRAGRLDEAVIEFERALALAPGNASSRNNLANALAQKGRTNEAIPHYEEALRLDPRSAGARINFGNTLLSANRIDDAIAQFRHASELDPRSPRPHYFLGRAYGIAGRFDEAIAEFRKVVAITPNDADAHSSIGLFQSRAGRHAEAAAAFEAALRIDPAHAVALRSLAAERAALASGASP